MDEKQNFNMKDYIEKRMLEITDLEQRRMFKCIVGDILVHVYEYSRNAYEKLESDILEECIEDGNRYAVYISITDRESYDETDAFLYPMRPEDVKKENISCQAIKDAAGRKEPVKLFTVFLKDTASRIYSLFNQKERLFLEIGIAHV